jgi:hypothetical protein
MIAVTKNERITIQACSGTTLYVLDRYGDHKSVNLVPFFDRLYHEYDGHVEECDNHLIMREIIKSMFYRSFNQ